MKRSYLLNGLFALLVLGLGFATAQNISRSVQLSQDPSGPIGFDTVNNSYFPNHINANSGAPTVNSGSCGTSPTVVGSDVAGTVTEGTGTVSSCLMNFRTAFNANPFCVASSSNIVTPIAIAAATTAGVNFKHAAENDSLVINYICLGKT